MGLESNKADSGTTEKQFGDESGELDLVGIDDDDIDQYIMSEHDASNKDKIWMAMNADYLREQKGKVGCLSKVLLVKMIDFYHKNHVNNGTANLSFRKFGLYLHIIGIWTLKEVLA